MTEVRIVVTYTPEDMVAIKGLVKGSEQAAQDGNVLLALQLLTAAFQKLIATAIRPTANSEQQTANSNGRFVEQESRSCREGYHDFCYTCICPCHMMPDKS